MTNIYLDCNASTQIDPEVLEVVIDRLQRPGNASSRTHVYGADAQRAVQRAREAVAALVAADPSEVVFTSGATEANNLALLGLQSALEESGRRHIVASLIEHKAVLEPLARLARSGFHISWVTPNQDGEVRADAVLSALRPDTGLVTLMSANNETGVVQPIDQVAAGLADHPAYLHTDASQSFGKHDSPLCEARIDLIAVSGHKVYAPQGVGALIARRRARMRPPLTPIMVGGGQEAGLRPGTLPVALIAGLGRAAEIARNNAAARATAVALIREHALSALQGSSWASTSSSTTRVLPHVLHGRFEGVDSEALMVAAKDVVALSNGSACTSRSYAPSHVLLAMGLAPGAIEQSIRISWSHLTREIPWRALVELAQAIRHH
jgi:cysteine desulfurase